MYNVKKNNGGVVRVLYLVFLCLECGLFFIFFTLTMIFTREFALYVKTFS